MSWKTAKRLWEANQDLAEACLNHPFVRGIASGDLSRGSFKFYVGQDAFFLESFARAYALALAKASTGTSIYAFRDQLDGVLDELRLHQTYAKRWGIELAPEPASATRSYTDFLLRVAWSEPVESIMAAMMPCMRLYSYLGQQLAPRLNPDSPYREWVDTYSADDFDLLAGKLEDLYNEHLGHEQPATRAEGYYRTAMKLELAFFQQAYEYSL